MLLCSLFCQIQQYSQTQCLPYIKANSTATTTVSTVTSEKPCPYISLSILAQPLLCALWTELQSIQRIYNSGAAIISPVIGSSNCIYRWDINHKKWDCHIWLALHFSDKTRNSTSSVKDQIYSAFVGSSETACYWISNYLQSNRLWFWEPYAKSYIKMGFYWMKRNLNWFFFQEWSRKFRRAVQPILSDSILQWNIVHL